MKTVKTCVYAALALFAGGISALSGHAAEASRDSLVIEGSVIGGGASGSFNPYMLGSWNYGKAPMAGTALADIRIDKLIDTGRRFDWSAGVEILAGYSAKATYLKYDLQQDTWSTNRQAPAPAWIQQAYASAKWRGIFINAGMKEWESPLVDGRLSSGDLVHSNNARPIPQVRIGFIDYQNIPFTNGWAQIEGCIAYGKAIDSKYQREHYNYWNGHIATGTLYTYKRVYFRSKPTVPLTVAIGVQSAGFFGGKTTWYHNGKQGRVTDNPDNLNAFWNMLIPSLRNGDGYVEGSHLGSWDLRASYSFGTGHRISGYFQWLWEDGSSMGRRNKWDGLWGVEYSRVSDGVTPLRGAVLEYIDFRDQSGPMHWAPGDNPGTDITTEATGGDDYYNNTSFNAYTAFGMSLGSPFVVSPVYNLNGFLQFEHTRSHGFHAAAYGDISGNVGWRAAVSYAAAWGSGRYHTNNALHNTSAMFEATYDASRLAKGLSASAAMAFDAGKLRGDNFGALVTIRYRFSVGF